MIFEKDVFGKYILLKKLLVSFIGIITHPGITVVNKTKIKGMEHLKNLSDNNVLFVSNHQTYFADVITFLHIFCSNKFGFSNKISNPIYLLKPRHNTYFVAAEETMKGGLLPKIFAYVGSISIKRTWREAGKDINRQVDLKDFSNIHEALKSGWVITFPQGTTKPFVPIRKGTAHIIKTSYPVVVPIQIDGFRRAFNKKGLLFKKRGVQLNVEIKEPIFFNETHTVDYILETIMDSIGQSEKFKPSTLPHAHTK
jgi:1-acyl-sn-glycerol-3-phosphate acyltransferase